MSQTQWECRTEFYQDPNSEVKSDIIKSPGDLVEISVGQKFLLTCSGSQVSLDTAHLRLELKKEDEFKLQVLKNLKSETSQIEWLVTSYRVQKSQDGKKDEPVELKDVVLTDGKSQVLLSSIKYQVNSVLNEKSPQQGYPPIGPFQIQYPYWIWIGFVVFIVFLINEFINRILKRRKKKKFTKKIKDNPPLVSNEFQLSKDIRQLDYLRTNSWSDEVALEFLKQIHMSLAWYLARKFQIDCFEIRSKEMVVELQKKQRIFKQDLSSEKIEIIRKAWVEIERAKKNQLKEMSEAGSLLDLLRSVLNLYQFKKRNT